MRIRVCPTSGVPLTVWIAAFLGFILTQNAESLFAETRTLTLQSSKAVDTDKATSPVVDDMYILQRGDEIEVRVFNIPELTQSTKIRPDGRISVLLLDDIQAAGLTTEQLDKVLTARYADYYREPQVTIIVKSFSRQQVYIGGEVNRPGVLELPSGLTALAAIVQAGGFRETAKTKEVILLRKSDGNKPLLTKLNLDGVLRDGRSDVVLLPYDVVYVPKSTIARLDQFVNQYIRELLPIPLSGGFSYIFGPAAGVVIK